MCYQSYVLEMCEFKHGVWAGVSFIAKYGCATSGMGSHFVFLFAQFMFSFGQALFQMALITLKELKLGF